jgi:acetyl esterase/lipase
VKGGIHVNAATQAYIIPLWPEGAPGSESWTQQEQEGLLPAPYGVRAVWNVSRPSLTAFLPDPAVATGAAAVVCPGGSFHFLAIEHEGTEVAHWLVKRGVAAFVLKYRLIRTPEAAEGVAKQTQETFADRDRMQEQVRQLYPLNTADGQQAVRLARQRASEWGVRPDRIGIMGFSAGGAVAATAALRYDAHSRPSFVAAIYTAPAGPVNVPADAPPLFLALATDDDMAAGASVPLYSAWTAAGGSAELHIFAKGGHGFGLRTPGQPSDRWSDLFDDWLRVQGLLDPPGLAIG